MGHATLDLPRPLTIAALALAGVAGSARDARAHDCEPQPTVFGTGCVQPGHITPMFRIDAGYVASRFALEPQHLDTSGLAPGLVDAYGGMFRFAMGAFGVFIGGELQLHRFDARVAPGAPLAARTTGELATADGRAGQVTFIGGYRASAGPVLLGLEGAAGLRNLWLAGADPDVNYATQGILDVRAHLGVWLSPFLMLGVQLGTSALRDHEHSALFTIGANVLPWDGLR
jgi:hypothetical protein